MGKYIKALEEGVADKKEKLTKYHAYGPEEKFVFDGNEEFSVLDFWKYAYSQLNGDNGTVAEFLVAQALGIKKAENVNYWTAYDMAYRNKRIEVKASSYIHPWNTKISNVRSFSVEPTNNEYWSSLIINDKQKEKVSRQSEVYVFCLNSNKDLNDVNPLRIDDWIFYVVPTYVINKYCNPNQKKISLNVVKRLSGEGVDFKGLKEKIDDAIDLSDNYYENL